MRLICPNCGAQYEVAEDVIPQGGRDVQCSNCGHTWFEEPGASERDEQAAMQQAEEPQAALSEPDPEPKAEPETEAEPEAEVEAEPEPERKPEPEAETEKTPSQAREIDPQVADILREEAAFEQAARRSEAQSIETQPDLGLEDSSDTEDQRTREARDRLARLRGEPEAGSAAAAAAIAANAPRRELLPDIEEINSTLRSDTGRASSDEEAFEDPAPRSGFRRGFMSVVVAALLGLGVYAGSDRIIAAVPATQGPVTSYVAWVDGLRGWLNDQMQSLADQRATQGETPPAENGTDG
ncbi:MAG: zinc-ribbon domain-containing protein [Octadecabacter sp.]|nr:zinc-ribbon domain-containing protein [Octadecabacter sp.]